MARTLRAIDRHLSNIECIHCYNIDVERRVVYLSSEYSDTDYSESGTEHQMYSRFVKNMDLLNSTGTEPIIVRSSNIGGDWNYGMAIFDTIKRSKCEVWFYMDSYAASMGSIIPQAASYRYISKHADFLVHMGTYALGNMDPAGFTNTVEFWNTKIPIMYDIYAKRCVNGPYFVENGFSESKVKAFIKKKLNDKKEWWMNAEDAIKYGFADEIY